MHNSWKFVGVRWGASSQKSPESAGVRSQEFAGVYWSSSEFAGVRSQEFVGVRRSSSEFAGVRRSSSELAGVRRSSSEFAGVRRSSQEFAGVRRSSPELTGVLLNLQICTRFFHIISIERRVWAYISSWLQVKTRAETNSQG